jgi:hypothetical protein
MDKRVRMKKNEKGAALLMAILFTMILNGIAMTLFVTSSGEKTSSSSHVVAYEAFNVAEAGLNVGLLRVKALMEANDPIDPDTPFMRPPFYLETEAIVGTDNLRLDEYRYFDLAALEPLSDAARNQINSSYINATYNTYLSSIDGFFTPQTSNPELFTAYLSGAEPEYISLLDTGESQFLRGWRIYLSNDNDSDDKTALLISVGYILDLRNNVLYQRKIEAKIYIHGMDLGKQPDPTGQITSSARGAATGRFRVSSDLDQPVSSYDLR